MISIDYSNAVVDLTLGTELKIHIKNVHCDDRPFKCDHKGCDSAFKQKENLKEHMLRHTQKKNFVCLVCDKGKLKIKDIKSSGLFQNSFPLQHSTTIQV